MEKKYVFIKPYQTDMGTIPMGTEIIFFRGLMYMNGGIVQPSYVGIIQRVIDDDKLHDEYLTDMNIIRNKI